MRIIFTAIALLIIYQTAILFGAVPFGTGRDNVETNCITSENWRYKKSLPDVILVGSSKTNFIDYDVLGPKFFHLGYGGQGCLTGLEILHKSRHIPKLILVEVSDTLQWPANTQCVNLGTSEYAIGDWILPMQHRYEPCGVLLHALCPQQIPNDFSREKLIAIQTHQLSIPLREDRRLQLSKNIARAKMMMNDLRSRGATVVLFDIPVERSVSETQFVREASEFVNAQFSTADFAKINYPSSLQHLRTRDGTHLLPSDGTAFSLWLGEALKKL